VKEGSALKDNIEKINLWGLDKSSIGDGACLDKKAIITVYHPDKPNGAAVVICPGGGYETLVNKPEGHGIAKWLNKSGIVGVVLDYRLPNGNYSIPLDDVQRAIRFVRYNAKSWLCETNHVGVIGFSAGGHLASSAATHFDYGNLESDDPINKISSRPDFAILIYPVITMGDDAHVSTKEQLLGDNPDSKLVELFSNDLQVTDDTPPTFLAHAKDDSVVVHDNSRSFYEQLQKHNVPSEYLELPSGNHGLNGYRGPMWDAWQKQSIEWLQIINMIP
jgi:acetyl esterase/lipase